MVDNKIEKSLYQRRPAAKVVTQLHSSTGNVQFQQLPDFRSNYPYRYKFNQSNSGTSPDMTIHVIGDTGGIKYPVSQQIVADAMEKDATTNNIDLCYHLGDVVYYYGENIDYYDQFYEPYQHYPAKIMGIPGNHDGEPADANSTSLQGFITNFCGTGAITPDAREIHRASVDQPNVYWTLDTSLFTVIGLYSNVPEGGRLEQDQIDWLASELKESSRHKKALLVAVHHPPYSYDDHHSGSQYIKDVLTEAFAKSKVHPDLVLSGHVHNYQRFTIDDKYPYLVVGNSGYWHLHAMKEKGLVVPLDVSEDEGNKVVLQQYVSDRHGFLKLGISKDTIKGEFLAVSRPQESWSAEPRSSDTFTFDLNEKKIVV
jgi:acid phosphatase type 7